MTDVGRPVTTRRSTLWLLVPITALALVPPTLSAQTIQGRLLDVDSGEPINLGILALLTMDGDTVTMTASDANGLFSMTAPEPGAFLLRASAWGYAEREDGAFELGEDSRMDIELRIAPRPMELDEILVPIDRPLTDHPLVRNGFVRRYQRGFGHFLTPRDLERTVYRDTEALFYFVPGVRVVTSQRATVGGRSVLGPSTDRVLMRDPFRGGWCMPGVIMDGVRTQYSPGTGQTLSFVVPIGWIEAVEIYRRPAEVPAEYAGVANSVECGVIVFWTKR